MHAPFSNERVLLLFANLIGDFKRDLSWRFAGVRFIPESLDPFLHPAFQGRVHRLFAHRQILGNGSDRPSFTVKLHNVVATLRRIRGIVKERKATHLDGWRRARSQHQLDRMMRGPPVKTQFANLRNFAQRHAGQFNAQIDNQLAHIWRKAPRCLLRLFAWPRSKQADHALRIKIIRFALQAGAWLTCLFCPLKSWISEKSDRSQEFVCRLLRPQRILSNGLPIFGMLSASHACALAPCTPNTMR